jgi:sulfite reductase beta subunit-like hemoprotein
MTAKMKPIAVERDKVAIGPDIDFDSIAARSLVEIPKNEIAMFKWTGIYHALQHGFFMLRVRVPGGILTSDDVVGVASIADQYAEGQLCLTTRQTMQMHWIRKEHLPTVLGALRDLGLDSKNACGDVTRNVVTCPLQGVCPHELGDVRETLLSLANDPEIRDVQRNLPRKHKISVAGCARGCGQTLMNCQGWHPVERVGADGNTQQGFRLYVGGGLGARPHLAQRIFDWVPDGLVVDVARATVEFYRREGNRRDRSLARLKIVVRRLGARRFAEGVLGVLKERSIAGTEAVEIAASPEPEILPSFLDGQSVVPQRQAGYSTVRIVVPRGELTTRDARCFAEWARRYGDSKLLLTARQNVHFRFVPNEQVSAFVAEIKAHGWAVEGFEHAPDIVACVGTTVCNLAVSDTPASYRQLYRALSEDAEYWRRVGPLRIHLNGCPNSCAQHWIADIGLRGMRRTDERGSEEGFTICIGGSLEGRGAIAQPLCDVPTSRVVTVVKRLLDAYLSERQSDGETFAAFVRRVGVAGCARLVGEVPAPAEALNVRNLRLNSALRVLVEEASHVGI